MKCGRDSSDIVFKCPTSTNPRPVTVVHKCVLCNCHIAPLFCNSPLISGVKFSFTFCILKIISGSEMISPIHAQNSPRKVEFGRGLQSVGVMKREL